MITPNPAQSLPCNRFESFEEFKLFVRKNFIEGSLVDPELFDACVQFHQDQEFDDGHDVSTPIHDALGWEFKRFTHQASQPFYAAFLMNEDGTVWQAIVSLWDDEKQRPYRYIAPKGNGDRAFLPPMPLSCRQKIGAIYGFEVPALGSFWKWAETVDIPRVLTEGGKKALCALSHGYLGISLYGCTCGAKNKDDQGRHVKPYLTDDLKNLAAEDSRWLFAFDRDENQKAKLAVASGKKRLRQVLNSIGCPTVDIMWLPEDGKGIDDFIKNRGRAGFDAAYQKGIAKLEKAYMHGSAGSSKDDTSKKKQHTNLLRDRWGDRLRFNEMTLTIELDGERLDLDTLDIRIAEEFNIDMGRDTACATVLLLAKKRIYHPVRQYLEKVAQEYSNQDRSIIDGIATRYFGTNDPLHDVFMRKHLIGQVRRVFEPGCQHDVAVVLQGKQGVKKSTFWRTLAVNPDWFDDTIASGSSDKDERLKLRRFWFLELAEIEAVFRRKEIASLRGFLTTKCDNLRVPYGRSIEAFPRTSGFVGSVNPAQFLVDPEGHRRFWVIPVLIDKIPIEMLANSLNQIWAAAVHAYRSGEQHWLTDEEEIRNALLNKRFEVEDSWQEVIELYVENLRQTTVTEILSHCLKIEIGRHDRSSQMRVAESLKRLGWVKGENKKINGKSTPIWKYQPEDERCQPDFEGFQLGVNQVSTKVSTTSNQDTVSFSDNRLIPFTENSPNLPEKEEGKEKKEKVVYQDREKGINGINLLPQILTSSELEVVETLVDTFKDKVDTSKFIPTGDDPGDGLGDGLKPKPDKEGDGGEGLSAVNFSKESEKNNFAENTNNLEIIEAQPVTNLSPSADDHEAVLGSVENIKEIIALMDGEVLKEFVQNWDEEFKFAVWVQLSTPERKVVHRIAPGALYRAKPISKPVEPDQLPVPTEEQIKVGTKVFVYCVRLGEWKPGIVEEIDDRFSPPYDWEIMLRNRTKVKARSLEKLRLR